MLKKQTNPVEIGNPEEHVDGCLNLCGQLGFTEENKVKNLCTLENLNTWKTLFWDDNAREMFRCSDVRGLFLTISANEPHGSTNRTKKT